MDNATSPYHSRGGWVCPACARIVLEATPDSAGRIRCPGCARSFETTTDGDSQPEPRADAVVPIPPALPKEQGFPDLAGYEILDVLGEGGMGIVYQARDRKLGRLVAIKMIRPGRARRSEQLQGLLQRFRREAESVARLQHPRIVQIFAIDDCPEGPFYVMEFVQGGTLAQRLDGTPWEAAPAAELVRMLAEGMQAAHAAGIVHRDLKPGNVLLPEGPLAPKITDFGLAKQLDAEMEQTRTGAVMGTPSYMAPEQADGRGTITPQADVYALGAILYEVLTGRPPFKGATTLETLDQVRNQDPLPPGQLAPRTPRDLETICLKCLRKEPQKRYAGAQALADDLGRFLRGEPILARPTGRLERWWKWTRRHPAAAALWLFVLLGTAAAFAAVLYDRWRTERYLEALTQSNQEKETARKNALLNAAKAEEAGKKALEQAELATKAQRETEVQRNRLLAAAGQRHLADGDWLPALLYFTEALALETDEARKESLRLRLETTARSAPRLLKVWSHSGRVVHVEFSRDGTKVLSAGRDGKVQVRQGDTGDPLLPPLQHSGPLNHAAFGPAGDRILAGGDDGIARLWDLAKGTPIGPDRKHRHPVLYVGFPPDRKGPFLTVSGERFAADRQVQGPPIMVPRQIPIGVGPGGVPRFTTIMVPQSSGITTTQKPFGLAQLWKDAEDKPATTLRQTGWINHAAFDPGGNRLVTAFAAMTGGNGAQMWDVAKGQRIETRLGHASQVLYAEFSPDGERIVSAGGPLESDRGEARLWSVRTGQPLGHTMPHNGPVLTARFSPDGSRILTASADGTARLWDGRTGEPQGVPLRHRDRLVAALWGPDGRQVLTAGADGSARLWDADNGQPLTPPLTHGSPVSAAAVSPKGHLLATACRDGTVRLWSVVEAGFEEQRLPLRPHVKDPPIMMRTWQAGPRTVKAQKVLPGTVATSVGFTPDGKHILVGAGARVVDLAPGGGEARSTAQLETNHLCVFARDGADPLFPPEPNTLAAPAAVLTRDGLVPVLAGTEKNRTLRLVEVAGGRLRKEIRLDTQGQIAALGLDDADRLLLVTTKALGNPKAPETELAVLDGRDGTALLPPFTVAGSVLEARLSGNGKVLAALVREAPGIQAPASSLKAYVWHLEKRARRLGLPLIMPGPANHLVLDQDGSWAGAWYLGMAQADVLGNQEGQAYLWETQSRRLLQVRHAGPVVDLAFSGDGRVATASIDRTARIWDLTRGEPTTPGLEHRGRVEKVRFAGPDLLVSGSADGTARLWDSRTGEALGPPLVHPESVLDLAYHMPTRRLATACGDGVVRVFALGAAPRTADEYGRLAQCLSGHRLDRTRSTTPVDGAAVEALLEKAAESFPFLSPPNSRDIASWHREKLARALQAQDAHAELHHLDHLLREGTPETTWLRLCGDALGRLNRFADAEKALSAYLAKAGDPAGEVRRMLAILQMRLGKKVAYRETCGQLVELAEKAPDLANGCRLLLPLELGDMAPETAARLDAWIDRHTAGLKDTDRGKIEAARWQGIVRLRSGRFAEAQPLLEKFPGPPTPSLQLLQGLNLKRLGRTADGKDLLAAARKSIDEDDQRAAAGFTLRRPPWWQRLHLNLLLEEAER